MDSFADRAYLVDILNRVLAFAQRTIERIDLLTPHWPDEQGSEGADQRDKTTSEAAILLLVAHRTAARLPQLRPAVESLRDALAVAVRNQNALMRSYRSRHSAVTLAMPHLVLNSVGSPDPSFDRFVEYSRMDPWPYVECAAFRIAESRWLRSLTSGGDIDFDDLLPFSIYATELNPWDMTRMDIYALTHWLMYASDFGARPLPPQLHATSADSIAAAIKRELPSEDLDLLGELLMGAWMLGGDFSTECIAAWSVLTAAWESLGFVPSPSFSAAQFKARTEEAKEAYAVANIYHTQFVFGMLAALLLQRTPRWTPREPLPRAITSSVIAECRKCAARAATFVGAELNPTLTEWPSQSIETWPVLSAIAHKKEAKTPFWITALEASLQEADRSRIGLDALLIEAVRQYDLDAVAKLLHLAVSAQHRSTPSPVVCSALVWLSQQQTPEGAIGAYFIDPANIETEEANTVSLLIANLLARAADYLADFMDTY